MEIREPTDEETVARLAAQPGHRSQELFAAVARLTEADLQVQWKEPRTKDRVLHLPFPIYSQAIDDILTWPNTWSSPSTNSDMLTDVHSTSPIPHRSDCVATSAPHPADF